MTHHHLDGDDARSYAGQHEPEPEQPEVADDDGESKAEADELESVERHCEAQRERQNEHDDDADVDAVPSSVADVHVHRVHVGAQSLAQMPVRRLQISTRHRVQRTSVVRVEYLSHNNTSRYPHYANYR